MEKHNSSKQTEHRKGDHLRLFKSGDVSARKTSTLLECVTLIHNSLPELKVDEIDLSTQFAGHIFNAPLMITGITGGTPEAREINRSLATVADSLGIGFGLGSQRAMLENPGLTKTYQVRDIAPKLFIAGNLGGVQLANTPIDNLKHILNTIDANALCVHLNPAQEMAQAEGDRNFSGVLKAIGKAVTALKIPVIVKETGAGISRQAGIKLLDVGVKYIDVAGVGGTSWVGVELTRSNMETNDEMENYWDWGIPTAAALAGLIDLDLELIASGGIRSGLDVARAIALGASLAGLAAPVLKAYYRGGKAGCEQYLLKLLDGLKTAMVLTGCRNLAELKKTPKIIEPPLSQWLKIKRL